MMCDCGTELNIDTIEQSGEPNNKTFYCNSCKSLLPDNIFEKIVEERETNKRVKEAEQLYKSGEITQDEAELKKGNELYINLSLNFKKLYGGKIKSRIVSRDLLITTTTDRKLLDKLQPIIDEFNTIITKHSTELNNDEAKRLMEILI